MKILSAFKCMFPAESLQKQSSQIIKGDHPKLDDSESVSKEEKAKYVQDRYIPMACHTWMI